MSVALIMEFEGVGQREYDAVMRRLDLGGTMPPGGIAHYAGPVAGGWRVVDVWESPQAFETFQRERLGAVLREEGLPEPRVTVVPVYNSM